MCKDAWGVSEPGALHALGVLGRGVCERVCERVLLLSLLRLPHTRASSIVAAGIALGLLLHRTDSTNSDTDMEHTADVLCKVLAESDKAQATHSATLRTRSHTTQRDPFGTLHTNTHTRLSHTHTLSLYTRTHTTLALHSMWWMKGEMSGGGAFACVEKSSDILSAAQPMHRCNTETYTHLQRGITQAEDSTRHTERDTDIAEAEEMLKTLTLRRAPHSAQTHTADTHTALACYHILFSSSMNTNSISPDQQPHTFASNTSTDNNYSFVSSSSTNNDANPSQDRLTE